MSVDHSLAVIDRHNDQLRACTTVIRDAEHGPGPLHGVTVGVKDNMDVAGTVRSDGLGPPWPDAAAEDAEAVRRLRAAGAAIVAKTNLEEISFGATTQNAYWGRCRNPADLQRLPGGSSGGSAVAVASGMVDVAIGSDTGGSLRNPAALCGVAALRPSYGLVPTHGMTSLAPDFDVVGPMAKTARELVMVLEVLAGAAPAHDARPASRVGVPRNFFYDDLHPDVAEAAEAFARELESEQGVLLVELELPGAERTPELLGVLLNSQAAREHPEWAEDPRIEPRVRERFELGLSVTDSARAAAAADAARFEEVLATVFEAVDVLLVPTTPTVAPLIDDTSMVEVSRAINRLNCAWALARLPALTVPGRVGRSGLPVGMQLVGPDRSDWRLLATAGPFRYAQGTTVGQGTGSPGRHM